MSMELRPEDLTAEEIHEATTKILADPLLHRFYNWSVNGCRALFAPAPSEAKVETTADRIAADLAAGTFRGVKPAPEKAAKVECPNCGKLTSESHSRYAGPGPDKWTCEHLAPAPEPVDTAKTVAYNNELDERYGDGTLARAMELSGLSIPTTPLAVEREEERQAAPPEPEKVKCPNCLGPVKTVSDHWAEIDPAGGEGFYCEPKADGGRALPEPVEEYTYETDRAIGAQVADAATVEPAAREMPEAMENAVSTLREFAGDFLKRDSYYSASDASKATKAADALEREWRNLAQPRMTEELREVLEFAARQHKDANTDTRVLWNPEYLVAVGEAIAAVRAQAAQPVAEEKVRQEGFDDGYLAGRTYERTFAQPVALPKVREYFDQLCKLPQYHNEQGRDFLEGIYAELNAAEGKGRG